MRAKLWANLHSACLNDVENYSFLCVNDNAICILNIFSESGMFRRESFGRKTFRMRSPMKMRGKKLFETFCIHICIYLMIYEIICYNDTE